MLKSKKKISDTYKLLNYMVDTQLIPRGIKDKNILDVMRKIPRHLFVPENYINEAYDDCPLPIGEGQTISQPYMVALMTELLELKGNEKVLEIGTGSGYQTAILASLSKEVYTIERIETLIIRAKKVLSELGFKNIHFKVGDGTEGWIEHAPYDRILVTAAAQEVPKPYYEQISEKGIIVLPLGDRFSQVLTVIKRINNEFSKKEICGCVFVPLIGKYGYTID